MNHAERSPITIQELVATFINVAEDHCVRNFNPGVPFIVTPLMGTIVICPAAV